MNRMTITVNKEKCTGCRICQIVCSIEKEKRIIPKLARISLISLLREARHEPRICRHCPDAPCAAVCPSEALQLGEKDLLSFDQDKCTQCELCIDACRYGVLRIDNNNGSPLVCDGCEGSFPCIENCPTGAIVIEN